MSNVRVRIAPSPTGYPHIGTIYQALFNYAYAHHFGGKFVIRIEDTDRERFVVDAEDRIFSGIDWFGLTEDESPRKGGEYEPYRQSERLDMYKKYALELIEKKHAYYCFCSKERLDEVRKKMQEEKKVPMYDKHCRFLPVEEAEKRVKAGEPFVIRMKIPENVTITVTDQIRGEISFESNSIDDQVILKADGYPTYHLAVVVDDHVMKITHVVRAEEWITSTPKHYLLYDYFEWEKPLFFHTSLLRNPDKSKLSKRHGHTNVNWYREEGYLPEAINNFLGLLGWSHPEGKEIFSLEEFISLFDLKDIKPVAPIFDLMKLNWMNQQYIQNMADDDLVKRLEAFYPYLREQKELLKRLLPLIKTRMETLKDFEVIAGHFFIEPNTQPRDEKEKKLRTMVHDHLSSVTNWNKDEVFAVFKSIMAEEKVRMPVFYYLLSGQERGLPLPESIEILGKEKTLQRLSSA